MLSQVRSAWTALAVAALMLLFVMRLRNAIRVVALAGRGAICIAPFLQLPDVSERVNARVETFKDMPNFDTSASARTNSPQR
jgi:O-antigen ligase